MIGRLKKCFSKRVARLAAALLIPLMVLTPTGAYSQEDAPTTPTAPAPARNMSGALRPGDMVEIRISGVPAEEVGQFTGTYNVDERGMLSLPYIGMVRGSGLLANQLQTSIEGRLRGEGIYTNPTITVLVHNNARFVNVRGAVRAPGRFPYTPDLTIMTAINAAGGFSEFGGKKIRLIRDRKTREITVKDIIRDPKKDIPVRPGDQIEALQSIF